MTVAELIEKLSQLPADADVFAITFEWGEEVTREIDAVYLDEDGDVVVTC